VRGMVVRGGMCVMQCRIVERPEKTFERLALAAQARALRGKDEVGLVIRQGRQSLLCPRASVLSSSFLSTPAFDSYQLPARHLPLSWHLG
jgi:hypothetical protein